MNYKLNNPKIMKRILEEFGGYTFNEKELSKAIKVLKRNKKNKLNKYLIKLKKHSKKTNKVLINSSFKSRGKKSKLYTSTIGLTFPETLQFLLNFNNYKYNEMEIKKLIVLTNEVVLNRLSYKVMKLSDKIFNYLIDNT
jgi:hypothetical protein